MPPTATVWLDMTSGKYSMVNNLNGDRVPCDRYGRTVNHFRKGVSGIADTRTRFAEHKARAEVLQESMAHMPRSRPPELSDEQRSTRVVTRGRYQLRLPSDAELYMRELRVRKSLFPEDFVETKADLVFKKNLAEAHANYRALEAQYGPRAGGIGGFDSKPPKRITQADLQPFMNMLDDAAPVTKNMDPFGLYRP